MRFPIVSSSPPPPLGPGPGPPPPHPHPRAHAPTRKRSHPRTNTRAGENALPGTRRLANTTSRTRASGSDPIGVSEH
jgi:hypothetical protein